MRALGLVPPFIAIALAAIFAGQNTQMVEIRWFALRSVEVPLGFTLLAATCGGCGVAAIAIGLLRPQIASVAGDEELERRVEQLKQY